MIKSLKLVLGLVFLGFLLFISSNKETPAQANTEKVAQKDKAQLTSLQQKQCTTETDEFLYSDCTGFFE